MVSRSAEPQAAVDESLLNSCKSWGGKSLAVRLAMVALLTLCPLPVARAQNICVHHEGREACVVHTADPNSGSHIWNLWTDNFYQCLELGSLGTQSLCLDLIEFDHITPTDTTSWHAGDPAVGEYELQYGWTSAQMESHLWTGSTCADCLEFVDTVVGDGEQDDIPYVQFSARFRHASQPVELTLYYRAHPDGYLEGWSRVTNTSAHAETTLYVHHLTNLRRRLAPAGWQTNTTSRWALEYVGPGETMSYKTVTPITGDCRLGNWSNDTSIRKSVPWFAVRYDNCPYTPAVCEEDTTTWLRGEGFVLSYAQPQGWPTETHLEQEKGREFDVRGYSIQRTASTDEDEGEDEGSRPPQFLPFVIPAGKSFETSHAYFMFTDGTIDDATARTHAFIRHHYVPTPPAEPDSMPRVQYLQYFWEYFEFTYATLMEQAEVCEDLGVELFVIDANWWKYSLFDDAPPCGFIANRFGTGYWFSDPCRFPEPDSTLADFGDELASRSMDLGLWVYPAAVDTMLLGMLDSLECWQKDAPTGDPCFCSDPPGPSCMRWLRSWHTQYQGTGDGWEFCTSASSDCPVNASELKRFGELCCAHHSAREWVEAQLDRLLDENAYGVKYLKFDGAIRACVSSNHSHCMPLFPGDTLCLRVQTSIMGDYQMSTEVRDGHAGVIYESPWPGGHVAVCADPTGELGRQPWWSRYSMESMRCYVPPPYTGCFLYEEPDTTGLTATQKLAIRKNYIRTAMLGPLTISCDVLEWSLPFRDLVVEAIGYYKENRRFVRGQAFNVLTQRSFCEDPTNPCEESWDAVEFFDPEEGDARVFVFRTASPDSTQVIVLQGLDAQEQYTVTGVDYGSLGTYAGSTLMTAGIAVTLSCTYSSEILEIEP
jgi:hypothetical protein